MNADVLAEIKTEFLDLIKQHMPCQHEIEPDAYYALMSCTGIRVPTERSDHMVFNCISRNVIGKLSKPTTLAVEAAFRKLTSTCSKASENPSHVESVQENSSAVEIQKQNALEQSLLLVDIQASWVINGNEIMDKFESDQHPLDSERTSWLCTDCIKAQEFMQNICKKDSFAVFAERIKYTSYKVMAYVQDVINLHVDMTLKIIYFYWSNRETFSNACNRE